MKRGGKASAHRNYPEKQKVEDKVVQEDAQEAASTPLVEGRTASTQTCTDFNETLHDSTIITEPMRNIPLKNCTSERGVNVKSWSASDDPVPQWLIEEALNRGRKFSKNNQRETESHEDKNRPVIASTLNHENIISDLEKQLRATRVELAEALNEQSIIKTKYKDALKNAKITATEERDELQRKLVQICTLVLDKFASDRLKIETPKLLLRKRRRPLQNFGKFTRKLRRKLRIATLTSAKLKREISSTRRTLHEKTRQYDSMAKCFTNLKIELENTGKNLYDLSNENVALRTKIDEAREWVQTRVGKDRNEKMNAAQFREIQRSRELANLKKKSEEDLSSIAQLRGKLLRSESANSNKGYLLNNYKSQVADLSKEKEKLSVRIKELETENSSLRNTNSMLRANVTLMNNNKEKFALETEKSETDMKERMQAKLATKYERSMLLEIEATKEKYDKIIEGIENKLRIAENTIAQYFGAIKHFLREIHRYQRDLDAERDSSCSEASEREAHETACTILNITPAELTGFLRGHSTTIDSWLSDLGKITTRKSFVEELGNFLIDRAIGTAKN